MNKPPNLEEMRLLALSSLHEKAQKTIERKSIQRNAPYPHQQQRPFNGQPTRNFNNNHDHVNRNYRNFNQRNNGNAYSSKSTLGKNYQVPGNQNHLAPNELSLIPRGPQSSNPTYNSNNFVGNNFNRNKNSGNFGNDIHRNNLLNYGSSNNISSISGNEPINHYAPDSSPSPETSTFTAHDEGLGNYSESSSPAPKLKGIYFMFPFFFFIIIQLTIYNLDAINAVSDLRSLGYNYYDLIVLAKVNPDFLSDHFPDFVPPKLLKRDLNEINSNSSPEIPDNSLTSVINPPSNENTRSSPPVSQEIPKGFSSISSNISSSDSTTKQPLPKVLDKITDSKISPVPIPINPMPTVHKIPSKVTSTLSHFPTNHHVAKKMKFGSNRWAGTINIIISDSEEDSDNETDIEKPTNSYGSSSQSSKRQTPTPQSQNVSSEHVKSLVEKISLLRQQIQKISSSKTNPSVKESKFPSHNTLSPSIDNQSPNSPSTPVDLCTPSSSVSLKDNEPLKILNQNRSNSNNDTVKALSDQLDIQREKLEQSINEKGAVLQEKNGYIGELAKLNVEFHERELNELRAALEKKTKEHMERSIAVATAKTRLEAVTFQEKIINETIAQLEKDISLNEKKIQESVVSIQDQSIDKIITDQATPAESIIDSFETVSDSNADIALKIDENQESDKDCVLEKATTDDTLDVLPNTFQDTEDLDIDVDSDIEVIDIESHIDTGNV